jgi:hypothetical protein
MNASEAEAKSLVAGADQFEDEQQVVTRNLRRGKCALVCLKLKWLLYGIMISVAVIFAAELFYHVGMGDFVTHWVGSLDLSLSVHNGTVDFHPLATNSSNNNNKNGGGKQPTPAPSEIGSKGTKPPSSIRGPTAAPAKTPEIDTKGDEKEPDSAETEQPKPKGVWYENEDQRPEEPSDSPNAVEDGEADTQTEKSDGEQQSESDPVPHPKEDNATLTWFEPVEPDWAAQDLDDVQEVVDTVPGEGESPEMRRPDDNGGFLDDDLPYSIIDDFVNNTLPLT